MIKPMLAATIEDESKLVFPLMASPKIDGVRAVISKDGLLMSRSSKEIPNRWTQSIVAPRGCGSILSGLDGELVVGNPRAPDCFNTTSSGVMAHSGEPAVSLLVFDCFERPDMPFRERYGDAKRKLERARLVGGASVYLLDHMLVKNLEELRAVEETWLMMGYEGAMLRDPIAPYKFGRSTLREGSLMKLKRFVDSEAVIISVEELMHNDNEETTAAGRRSTKKDGLRSGGVLGALVVQDLKTHVKFKVGSGFTAKDRAYLWATHARLPGQIIKYKYFPTGNVAAPRFPTFLGFRNALDM